MKNRTGMVKPYFSLKILAFFINLVTYFLKLKFYFRQENKINKKLLLQLL